MTFQEATKLAKELSSDQVAYGVCKTSKAHPEVSPYYVKRNSDRVPAEESPQGLFA
jgi:hypothetical protein